jgi:hypothetical protein
MALFCCKRSAIGTDYPFVIVDTLKSIPGNTFVTDDRPWEKTIPMRMKNQGLYVIGRRLSTGIHQRAPASTVISCGIRIGAVSTRLPHAPPPANPVDNL